MEVRVVSKLKQVTKYKCLGRGGSKRRSERWLAIICAHGVACQLGPNGCGDKIIDEEAFG